MSQPLGSVFGFIRPHAPTSAARPSPAPSTLVFLTEILCLRKSHTCTFSLATQEAFNRRYEADESSTDGLHAMKFGTIARWVFFVLGTHGCIIKLAIAEGIPLTKIRGFAYMVSFTVFEAFIWLVPREKRDLALEPRSPDSRQQIRFPLAQLGQ